MANAFKQLDDRQRVIDEIFRLWKRGKALEILPPFLSVAKQIGKEYYYKTGKVAKIKVK